MSSIEPQPSKNQVFVRFTSDAAVKAFFPNAATVRSIFKGATNPFAFVTFDTEEEVQDALKLQIEGLTIEPMKDREQQLAEAAEFRSQTESISPAPTEHIPRDYLDVTKIDCTPDVSSHSLPDDVELTMVLDPTTPTGGHIYKRTELKSKHMHSVQFCPRAGSNLSANVELGGYNFKVVSIRVNTMNNSVFISLLIHEPVSKTTGVVSLRRTTEEDGTFSYSRHCFNLLVNPEDYDKNDEDEVDVHFVSIESITVDPQTALWTNLRIAIDAVTAPLSVFKRRGRRPVRPFAHIPRPFVARPFHPSNVHIPKPYRMNMIPQHHHYNAFQPQHHYVPAHPAQAQYHSPQRHVIPNRQNVPRNTRRFNTRPSSQDAAKSTEQDLNSNRYARAAASHGTLRAETGSE